METKKMIAILDKICDVLIENEEILTNLDRKIGDGDHGINIKRGFLEIKKQLPLYQDRSLKDIFNGIAMILMSRVGGASGPLLASAFMSASSKENLGQILEAMAQGVQKLGKAEVGEKTMLDVLKPASDTYNLAIQNGLSEKLAMKQVVEIAKEKLEATKLIAATKGRASYLGDRSIGTEDPGAYTIYLMLNTLYEEL